MHSSPRSQHSSNLPPLIGSWCKVPLLTEHRITDMHTIIHARAHRILGYIVPFYFIISVVLLFRTMTRFLCPYTTFFVMYTTISVVESDCPTHPLLLPPDFVRSAKCRFNKSPRNSYISHCCTKHQVFKFNYHITKLYPDDELSYAHVCSEMFWRPTTSLELKQTTGAAATTAQLRREQVLDAIVCQ